jgi:K(+)-stimulated pyrophosphate-energized sodium pump
MVYYGFAGGAALLAWALAAWLYSWVRQQPPGSKEVEGIGALIQRGARTFLRREYTLLGWFVLGASLLITLFLPRPFWQGSIRDNLWLAGAYIAGAFFSGFAGYVGMAVATMANTRTAQAATRGKAPAFLTGFRGGAVMGMAVVGASLLGVTAVIFITKDPGITLGFSLGASSLALFAKAGGGIFTKTADIAADLVGKVELDIPEDDPRNPAVIADNVGDNVGDVAGMGADLFDSHVASLSAALVLAAALDGGLGKNVSMVFAFAAAGLIASIIGVVAARINEKGDPTTALNSSTYVTTGLYVVLSGVITALGGFNWLYWGATMVGLAVGTIIGISSDYFTNDRRKPVERVASVSQSGPAFTIISGMSYGLASVFPALIGIGVAALLSFTMTNGIVDGIVGMAGG